MWNNIIPSLIDCHLKETDKPFGLEPYSQIQDIMVWKTRLCSTASYLLLLELIF